MNVRYWYSDTSFHLKGIAASPPALLSYKNSAPRIIIKFWKFKPTVHSNPLSQVCFLVFLTQKSWSWEWQDFFCISTAIKQGKARGFGSILNIFLGSFQRFAQSIHNNWIDEWMSQGMDKRMSFIIFDLKKVKMNIHWKNKTKFFKRDSFRKRLFKHYCAWNQKLKRNEILKETRKVTENFLNWGYRNKTAVYSWLEVPRIITKKEVTETQRIPQSCFAKNDNTRINVLLTPWIRDTK